jgi:hypothetical protein
MEETEAGKHRTTMAGKGKIAKFNLEQGKKLMDWLNASAEFQGATKWFDGSILLVSDSEILWLKVYSGRVIDVKDKPSPFGFTFALKATGENWTRLLKAERNELLAFTGSGKIQVEGNQLEFMRLTKTAILLVDGLRALG